ncbi:hypothetical protein ACFTAO_28945 [Paenibacillus rhizoplanae]
MFTDNSPLAQSMARSLRGENRRVIEVKRGRRFARLDSDTYICGGSKGGVCPAFFEEEECMHSGLLLYLWGADPCVSDESLLLTFFCIWLRR